MHRTRARQGRPRPSRALGAANGICAAPTARSGALPDLMTCGWRAGLALFLGATRSLQPVEDIDPADFYGDFA